MLNGGPVRAAAVIIAAVLSLTAAGCGSATSRPDTQVPSPSPGRDGRADPPAAAAWADRSRSSPAMIRDADAAWRAFRAIGWTWGGDWRSLKDYMHFSANGL